MYLINILTRYPEPGKTKTRLIPCLGAAGAANLQRRMTEHMVQELSHGPEWQTLLCVDGAPDEEFRRWLGPVDTIQQAEGALGERIQETFREAFRRGATKALTVGIDCPSIDQELCREAFDLMESCDVVFGPATDGGYYLIGMNAGVMEKAVSLFGDLPWGQEGVLSESLKRLKASGLSKGLLAERHDIDLPDDLVVWENAVLNNPVSSAAEKISIVIPVKNEAATIRASLEELSSGENIERIVVDGGSTDDTVRLAEEAGCRVIKSAPGRGTQMNAGAAAASGEILLFLHADTLLPVGYDSHVRRFLDKAPHLLGAFLFAVDDPAPEARLLEWMVNWRASRRNIPYGDQVLFLRREHFEHMGRFREIPLMEDYEFVLRCRKQGGVGLLPVSACTSGRRWRTLGPIRTTLLNQMIIIAYHSGVSPETLAKWYKRGRKQPAGKVQHATTEVTDD